MTDPRQLKRAGSPNKSSPLSNEPSATIDSTDSGNTGSAKAEGKPTSLGVKQASEIIDRAWDAGFTGIKPTSPEAIPDHAQRLIDALESGFAKGSISDESLADAVSILRIAHPDLRSSR